MQDNIVIYRLQYVTHVNNIFWKNIFEKESPLNSFQSIINF